MPGTVTMPAEASDAVVGIRPSRIDETMLGRAVSHAVAPKASSVSTSSRRSRMLSKNRLNPTASVETVLPSSMPVSGTTSCGAYQGWGRITSSTTVDIMMSMVITRLSSTGPTSPFGTPLARESVICTAATSMNAMSSSTNHGLPEWMTKDMMKPIAHNCSRARQADHSSVPPMPMRIKAEMPAAMATITSATSRPAMSIE